MGFTGNFNVCIGIYCVYTYTDISSYLNQSKRFPQMADAVLDMVRRMQLR